MRTQGYTPEMATNSQPAPARINVVDLQTGNIGSVIKMLNRIGADPKVVQSANELEPGVPVIFPGVGHYTQASSALDASGLREPLDDAFRSGRPFLGICLGAQLMGTGSEEGAGQGLGWLPTRVRRFPPQDTSGRPLRVPHMAWQPFAPAPGALPFDVPPGRMYFAHSYYIDPTPLGSEVACASEFGGVRFVSVARVGNAVGAQFHPEKSHIFGMSFLRGWIGWATTAVGR